MMKNSQLPLIGGARRVVRLAVIAAIVGSGAYSQLSFAVCDPANPTAAGNVYNTSVTTTSLSSTTAIDCVINTGTITNQVGISASAASPTIYNAGTLSVPSGGNAGIWANTGSTGAVITNTASGSILSAGTTSAMTSSAASTVFTNAGAITSTGSGTAQVIWLGGANSSVTNSSSGVINLTGTSQGLVADSTGLTVTNAGTISLTGGGTGNGTVSSWNTALSGIYFNPSSSGSTSNTGTISISGVRYLAGIYNAGALSSLSNSGTITATASTGNGYGIWNNSSGGVITELTNTGTISASGANSYGIFNASTATITTLNNAQGAGNAAGALTYSGKLPTNYSIIINSTGSFGRLAVSNASGSTAFSINSGSTVANNTKYSSVITGLGASSITGTSGTYSGYSWVLGLASGSTDVWDLIFGSLIPPGPSTADTQTSLVNTASSLQNIYTLQNSVLANSFSYDCSLFDKNNICVSAGGRNTAVSAANGLNNTSGLLIAAYRPHMNYRVGVYVDQNLSVNNAGSTVSLGNNTPLIGLFGAWNERLDGTGTEVKVSAAYGQKNTTVTRAVVGTGSTASEAGSGSSQLNSQGAQVLAKYGFGIVNNVIVSPYAGVRYTQNNMGAYTEGTSSSVTAPLTYSALNTNATTALAGVGVSYRFIPQAMAFASAGVETDTNTANGSYSATGVSGLTAVNFNANPVKTRPTATVGAYYDVEKNQRLGVTGIYRQEPYQAVSTTAVMATYTMGL